MIYNRVLCKEFIRMMAPIEVEEHAYLDHLEKFFRAVNTSNRELVKQLDWEQYIELSRDMRE